MTASLEPLLQWLIASPEWLVLLVLGVAALVENLFPPIPADTVVLFGGFLAARGAAGVWGAFLAVWIANVAGALIVYAFGRRYGISFFHGRLGRMILEPQQLARLDRFYRRWGVGVIFLSRFLPMFRAVVPVFAGVARLSVLRTALPLGTASALWYGGLVYLGAAAGENWPALAARVESAGKWIWIIAAPLVVAVALWWWRTRRHRERAG
jgi:membrane protein DedA with SNARE-associated domain